MLIVNFTTKNVYIVVCWFWKQQKLIAAQIKKTQSWQELVWVCLCNKTEQELSQVIV